MNLWDQIYIDGKGFAELADDMDKRIVLESARMLQEYEDEIRQYPEGMINISKFGSIEITGFPKEVTRMIRNILME
jgi:hypothetical protein